MVIVNPKKELFQEDSDDMFVRDVCVRVSKKRALTFTLMNGVEHTIYVTGIDQEWIRGCIADPETNNEPVWIKRDHVASMSDSDITYANRDLYSKDQTESIGFYTSSARKRARDALESARNDILGE